jgi:hypothetical protein
MPFLRSIPIAVLSLAAACAPYPLHSNMTDAQIRAVVGDNFPRGLSQDQVGAKLSELRVPDRVRHLYPAEGSRPPVLLARLLPPGGAWLNEGDQTIDWVDLSFVFNPPGSLDRVLLFRDNVRYFQGRPISQPRRPAVRPVDDYPIAPPPPMDPLEGAT